jgi:glycine hydroxymethyltransferase
VTTRGFKETEISELSGWMADVLDRSDDDNLIAKVRNKALDLCSGFPVYQWARQ